MGKRKSPEQKLMEAIFGKNMERKDEVMAKYYENQAENVTDEEFKTMWGISLDEHVKKMMDYIHELEEKSNPSLKLVLKRKWFDMIDSGEKLEEYRAKTDYWRKRIEPFMDLLRQGISCNVTFYEGYSKDRRRITLLIRDITEGTGKTKWGAVPGEEYYVIKLGDKMP